jgi:hypothetical protein
MNHSEKSVKVNSKNHCSSGRFGCSHANSKIYARISSFAHSKRAAAAKREKKNQTHNTNLESKSAGH